MSSSLSVPTRRSVISRGGSGYRSDRGRRGCSRFIAAVIATVPTTPAIAPSSRRGVRRVALESDMSLVWMAMRAGCERDGDRKDVGEGKGVADRGELGGGR